MLKLILGLLKGALVGAALGYAAFAAHLSGGWNWVVYGAIGALVGLVAGRPLWALITDKDGTTWISVLKALFGFGVGCGLYALVDRAWGGFVLSLSFLDAEPRLFQHWQPAFGAAVGGFLGGFFEIDDAIGSDSPPAKGKALPAGRKPAARK